MLLGLRDALEKADRRQISATKRLDDVIDKLNTAIKAYVMSFDAEELTDGDHRRAIQILAFAQTWSRPGTWSKTTCLVASGSS